MLIDENKISLRDKDKKVEIVVSNEIVKNNTRFKEY